MKKELKFLAFLVVIAIIVTIATGCSIVPSVGGFAEQAQNAQDQAEQMGGQIQDFIGKLEGAENEFEDYFGVSDNKPENAEGPYEVLRVVDGDTFVVIKNGEEVKVRLIGVDTPESAATGDNAYKNCEEGKIASDFTKDLIEGKYVYLEYDIDPNDDYGRHLAYAYLSDGTMLNKTLLEKGYARMMTIQPNVRYVDDFIDIQENARNNKAGFWKDFETWQED
jgi:micrococcal nuclease